MKLGNLIMSMKVMELKKLQMIKLWNLIMTMKVMDLKKL